MEYNFLEMQVTPIIPKAVADEQILVFVPVGQTSLAGILKPSSGDFSVDINGLLTVFDGEIVENGKNFVRSGKIYDALAALDGKKQDKAINIEGISAKTVKGALAEIKGNAVKNAQDISALNDTVQDINETQLPAVRASIDVIKQVLGNKDSGLVQKVEHNSLAIQVVDKGLGTVKENLQTTNNNVTNLSNNKQDKAINISGVEAKNVEGALQELNGKSNTNAESITDLKAADEELTTKVRNLEQSAYGGETPIGSYDSGPTLPSEDELTNFVITHTTPSRAPKLGDVVLFTQIVTGGTDKSYKFMYTASEPEHWVNYVIPTVESATNTDKGIIQGTVGDTTGNIQVSIVDGKVADILVKDGTTYKSIKTLLDGLVTKINNAQSAADNVIKKYNNVEFTLVSSTDATLTNFPCKYTANIEGVTISNVADVYFSALQIPLEIFSSYVQVEDGKVSIFATTKANYPTSLTVPTVRIS